jgi:molybdate transport system substrate-binding protein
MMRAGTLSRICVVLAACAALAASSCSRHEAGEPQSRSRTLIVLAAASLADAFREAGSGFEAVNPGVHVDFAFAGSNQLRSQLESGGPGDVFASADRRQMEAAAASGAVDSGSTTPLCGNRLVIIVPRQDRAGVHELADLARRGVKIVVADRAVPAGNYTRRMLSRASELSRFGPAFVSAFDANTVSREQNVASVVAKVALNEADAGLAYSSDAAGGNGSKLTVVPLPVDLEQHAEYQVAVASGARDVALAKKFIAFLLSDDGQGALANRGFERAVHP